MYRPDDPGYDNHPKDYRPDQLPEIEPEEANNYGQQSMQSVGDILQDQQHSITSPEPSSQSIPAVKRKRSLKSILIFSALLGFMAGLVLIASLLLFDKI